VKISAGSPADFERLLSAVAKHAKELGPLYVTKAPVKAPVRKTIRKRSAK
jgi:hypothetical protein